MRRKHLLFEIVIQNHITHNLKCACLPKTIKLTIETGQIIVC